MTEAKSVGQLALAVRGEVGSAAITPAWAALECLRLIDEFSADDLALPDLRAGAQAFALLAVADALGAPSGENAAEALLEVRDAITEHEVA